jgi:hypothetical protein
MVEDTISASKQCQTSNQFDLAAEENRKSWKYAISRSTIPPFSKSVLDVFNLPLLMCFRTMDL